jgi:hypothetical protein
VIIVNNSFRYESPENPEVWSGKVNLPVNQDVKYRYFVSIQLENANGTHDKAIVMRRWETNLSPRNIKRTSSINGDRVT